MSVPDQWYLSRNNQKYGPYPTETMKQFAGSGNLAPTDMVMQDGTEKWVAASTVFFTSAVQPPPPPPPPVAVPAPEAAPSPQGSAEGQAQAGEQAPISWGEAFRHDAGRLKDWFLSLSKGQKWAVVGGLFLMLLICGGFFSKGKSGDGKGGGPAITIQAYELIREYKANEAAANAKYEDKIIEVSGPIKAIKSNRVEPKGWGMELVTVDCFFDDPRKLVELSVGREITIRGTCDGRTPFAVNVRDCKIIWKQ